MTTTQLMDMLSGPPTMTQAGDYSYPNNREKITCADGFTVSIQASNGHYCKPRNNDGGYTEFELGYPSSPDDLIQEFAEDPDAPCSTVYGYVPKAVVQALIEKHGGPVEP